jgi:glucose-6-phosphate dehydrogenase assembly protein OpcA
MSSSPTDAFYEGQGIPVELAEVEDTLDRLWGPAAAKAGGPELENPAVTRVALANVVVVLLGPDRPGLEETIGAITSRYPSRLIVLRSSPDSGRRLEAEVSAQCHLPSPGRPQVCSEVIILRTPPEGCDLLPGAVRSLRESELHSVLWWCDDPRSAPDMFTQLAEGSTRVIFDRPDPESDPAAVASASWNDPDSKVRDLAWFGLTPWRERIADLFDPPATSELTRIASIRIRSQADSIKRTPRAAAWLVAWLAGQLRWEPVGSPVEKGAGQLEATFQGPGGPVTIRIDTDRADVGPLARIVEVELGLPCDAKPNGAVRVHRAGPETCEVQIALADRSEPTFPRMVVAPEYNASSLVSAALLSDRNDPPYRRALPIALWLLGC